MSNKIYIGIDIGKNGGIASIHPDGTIMTFRIPAIKDQIDTKVFGELIQTYSEFGLENIIFALEDVHSIFNVSAKANFQFGRAAGLAEGYVTALKAPHLFVAPKAWQAISLIGVPKIFEPGKEGKKVDTKAMALIAAQRLYPNADLVAGATARATKPHDGIIDALLIAHYLKQTHK